MTRRIAFGLACVVASVGASAAALAVSWDRTAQPTKPRIIGPRDTTDRTPSFRFVSHEAGFRDRALRFRCGVDRKRPHGCPRRYTLRLNVGRHLLRVRAVDPEGRRSSASSAQVNVIRPLPRADRTIRVGSEPYNVAEGFGSVWVTVARGLVRLDPATGAVIARIDVGGRPWGVATGGGAVWIANQEDSTVSRIDPSTNAIVWRARLDQDPLSSPSPVGVTIGGGSVWAADNGSDKVWRLDPGTGQILGVAHIGDSHEFVGFGEGVVWVASENGTVGRIDPTSGAVTKLITAGSDADFLGFSPGAVWVTNYQTGSLFRLDPATGDVAAKFEIGAGAQGVAFDGSSLWVAKYNYAQVLRVDPATGRVQRRVRIGLKPRGVAVAGGSVWVANSRSGTVSQIRIPP